jgi:hypothetical protein
MGQMDKATFQDLMWLFQEFGRHLKSCSTYEAASGTDTRTLLKQAIQDYKRQPYGVTGGRNPLNWLKELSSTLNFWFHLQPGSIVPRDDIWRDLDTLDRVATYLGLDQEFLTDVRQVKEQMRVETSSDYRDSEEDLRIWIRQEISKQLEEVTERQLAAASLTTTPKSSALAPITNMPGERTQSHDRKEVVSANPKLDTASCLTTPPKVHTQPIGQHGEIADRVRSFVLDTYVTPARAENISEIRVKAGDIDKALGFRFRRLPLICSALRATKFLEMARAELVGEEGPESGASTTTTFKFRLK